MGLTAVIALGLVVTVGVLLAIMLAQKPASRAQRLIHQHKYEDAVAAADRDIDRGEALKLLGRFDEAIASYRRSEDPAAREGIALSLAHLGRDLDEATRLMEETIAAHPQIQEFQALALAFIHLRNGKREEALRLFDDNLVLLQTRFRDDYTDADPMLAETLYLFSELTAAAGDAEKASTLKWLAAQWAPGSVWALPHPP
jgi:tetratricopeptide (TPR) repeat protein